MSIYEYFLDHPCVACGESDPVVLELDHVRGEKKANVSDMSRSSNRLAKNTGGDRQMRGPLRELSQAKDGN